MRPESIADVVARVRSNVLSKDLKKYADYSFKFISISKDAKGLRNLNFLNPHNLKFIPDDDIFDIPSLLAIVKELDIDSLKNIYELIKKELNTDPDPAKIESNLTTVINILSNMDLSIKSEISESIPFDIENKITYNQLDKAKVIIEDFKIHNQRLDKIYSEYDKLGVNKSLSVLNGIRSLYLEFVSTNNPDQIFFNTIKEAQNRIKESANYKPLPEEELELCVQILVVDSFIRCKIFKNPIEKSDADS